MDDDPCVLAIDLGTSGPKVALIDRTGVALSWSSAPVATQLLDGGGAEQDPTEMWRAIVSATRATLGGVGAVPPIAAVAVTSQYMSTVPIAADGTPTGPCILWMDTRGGEHSASLLTDDSFLLFAERHGLIPLPSGMDGVAHAHVLRTRHPDAWERAAAIVEPMDHVTARLTGRATATQSTAFGQLVCDNRTWGVTDYDADLVAATGLDPGKLPPLVPLGSVIGDVLGPVAAELGIPAGTPVVAGTIDSITSAVGAGALEPSDCAVVIGTTAVMVTHIREHRSDLLSGLLAVPSPLRDRWFVLAENGVGGRALDWALGVLGYGTDLERALADAAGVPAGAGGAQFLPWLLGSLAPSPSDDVRGGFVGASLHHDRRHLVRAVLEGVATNLGWLRGPVEAFAGGPFPVVRFGGGGALSALWGQVLADALDRPVHRLAQPRVTNARGAAFLAFAELGLVDLGDVPGLLRVDEVHEPTPHGRAVAEALLARHTALHAVLSTLPAPPT